MNCEKCLDVCKANCCLGPVPMNREWFMKQHHVRPPVLEHPMSNEHVIAPLALIDNGDGTHTGVCPLLGLDNRCTVYSNRPPVCREFGSEIDIHMTCSIQAADGRMRGRQERRRIERGQNERMKKHQKLLEVLR